jgi:hypothetical protein
MPLGTAEVHHSFSVEGVALHQQVDHPRRAPISRKIDLPARFCAESIADADMTSVMIYLLVE